MFLFGRKNTDPHQQTAILCLSLVMVVPRMASGYRKGVLGKVTVLGGSRDYSGAPYFAAAMRMGCDIAHIFTSDLEVATAIRSYSPELIVSYPYTRCLRQDSPAGPDHKSVPHRTWLSSYTSVVIGPGLGRDNTKQKVTLLENVIRECRSHKIPLVIDADALHLIQYCVESLQGYNYAVLTPNRIEMGRLFDSITPNHPVDHDKEENKEIEMAKHVATKLNGAVILLKRENDFIITNKHSIALNKLHTTHEAKSDLPLDSLHEKVHLVIHCLAKLCTAHADESDSLHEKICLRRVGGQGDMLCGILGTFLGWWKRFCGRVSGGNTVINSLPGALQEQLREAFGEDKLDQSENMLMYIAGASTVMRYASGRSYVKHARGMLVADILEELRTVSGRLM